MRSIIIIASGLMVSDKLILELRLLGKCNTVDHAFSYSLCNNDKENKCLKWSTVVFYCFNNAYLA